MGDKKLKIMFILCVATALLAFVVLYYLGWSTPARNTPPLTSTSTATTTSTGDETITVTKPPVVVPSGDLHVIPSKTCKVGGCSGEICSEQEMLSSCIYRAEYSCYKKAKCEVQPSGECGWTPTTELDACLKANVDVSPLPQ